MKENETLLMLGNVNQQIARRSRTQRCLRSPTGTPRVEVRKHLTVGLIQPADERCTTVEADAGEVD